MVNVFQPLFEQQEIDAITSTLLKQWPGRGEQAAEFERAWARYLGVDPTSIIATTTATDGLFAIMQLLNLQLDDEVILPSICFSGAANAVIAAGGRPVFCDVDAATLNPTSETVASILSPRTCALLVLHYAGRPVEMKPLLELPFTLIEDCAIAPASTYRGFRCGTLAEFGIWSFDAMKTMSTGDGGVVYCRDPEQANQLRLLLSLGQDSPSGHTSTHPRWWEFDITCVGRRGLMNDLAASIGLAQLPKLSSFITRRSELYKIYYRHLKHLAQAGILALPLPAPGYMQHSYSFFPVQTQYTHERDNLAKYLREKDIYTTFRYHPLHTIPFYAKRSPRLIPLPDSEKAAAHTLLLPLHQSLTDQDVEIICNHIQRFFAHAGL